MTTEAATTDGIARRARTRIRAVETSPAIAGAASNAATIPLSVHATTTGGNRPNEATATWLSPRHILTPSIRTLTRSCHARIDHCMASPTPMKRSGTPTTAAIAARRRSPTSAGSARHHGIPEAQRRRNAQSWPSADRSRRRSGSSPHSETCNSASEIALKSANTARHTMAFEATTARTPAGSAQSGRPAARPSQ